MPTREQIAANRSTWTTFAAGPSRASIGNLRGDLWVLYRWLKNMIETGYLQYGVV